MAYARFGPALRRIREVVEQSAGTLRTTPFGRFGGEAPTGLEDAGLLSRAVDRPRVESRIVSLAPSPSSPPVGGSVRIYDVTFEIRVTRLVTPLEQVSDEGRDTLMAAVAEDADSLNQALGYPGNLSRTAAGTATDIVSGVLVPLDARFDVRGTTNDGAQPIETTLTMLGRLLARPATS